MQDEPTWHEPIRVGHVLVSPLFDGRMLRAGRRQERFWSRVAVGDKDECWEWTAGTTQGYGQVGFGNRRPKRAHQLAYEFTYGPVPKGMHVHHHCRNRLCCNPEHLEAMSAIDHVRLHNPPEACPHGAGGKAKCLECDADRKRRERAEMTAEERDEQRRRDRERKRAKRAQMTPKELEALRRRQREWQRRNRTA